MKKLFSFALIAVFAVPAFAQETGAKNDAPEKQEVRKAESTVWPAFFAICEYPAATDVVGLRLTLPFSTRQGNVSGVDFGLWGRCDYFEGVQVNVFRNDVRDSASAFQIGLYNSVGIGNLWGMQIGLWNEACALVGMQVGLVNVSGETEGFQFGLINRSETLHGYQVGLINIIRDAEIRFCPVLNIGF